MSASTRVTWNTSQNAESFVGLHIWGFTGEGQRSVIRKEDVVVNYSCVPGRELQYSSWVPTALYLLGLNTLILTLLGGVLGGGGRGSPITTRKYFQVSTLCVCVCVCVCVPVHVCTCVHLCPFTGVGWAACMLAVIIMEVNVILPKAPPTHPL